MLARLDELRAHGFALPVEPNRDIDFLELLADRCEAYRVPSELAEAHLHLARAQWRPTERAAAHGVRGDRAVRTTLAAHLAALDDAELDRVQMHVAGELARPGPTPAEAVLIEGLADLLGL